MRSPIAMPLQTQFGVAPARVFAPGCVSRMCAVSLTESVTGAPVSGLTVTDWPLMAVTEAYNARGERFAPASRARQARERTR